MTLRKMTLQDYDTIVDMLISFFEEVYHDRKIGYRYSFYKTVMDWVDNNRDVIVCEDNGVIVGFSSSFVDRCNGMTEPVYNSEYLYVKPEFRKSKAAYMLYSNVYSYSQELNIKPYIVCRIEDGVRDMVAKKFEATEKFTVMQGVTNE